MQLIKVLKISGIGYDDAELGEKLQSCDSPGAGLMISDRYGMKQSVIINNNNVSLLHTPDGCSEMSCFRVGLFNLVPGETPSCNFLLQP